MRNNYLALVDKTKTPPLRTIQGYDSFRDKKNEYETNSLPEKYKNEFLKRRCEAATGWLIMFFVKDLVKMLKHPQWSSFTAG
jgi:hypothetical protein